MRSISLITILGLLSVHGIEQGQRASQGSRQDVVVEVVNGDGTQAIAGAKVWVASDTWKELTSATTDKLGEARLSIPLGGERPKYVLAEKENYYLSGRLWHPGYTKFYIQTVLIRLF